MPKPFSPQDHGVPPWEPRDASPAASGVLPGLDMAVLRTSGSREAREWCEAWLEEWLEAGGARARIGQHPADWEHWWGALRRRGLGRAVGLGQWAAFRIETHPDEKKRLWKISNRMPRVTQMWRQRDGEHVAAYPVPNEDWWEWWSQEIGNDLRMLACLWERQQMMTSPGRVAYSALRQELRVYEKVEQYQRRWHRDT